MNTAKTYTGRKVAIPPQRKRATGTLPRKMRGRMAAPYCRKTYSDQFKLLMRQEMKPQIGTRNVEIRPENEKDDIPMGKWIGCLFKIKANMKDLRIQPERPPST